MPESNTVYLSAATCLAVPFLDRIASASAAGFSGMSMFRSDLETINASGVSSAELRTRMSDSGMILTELEGITNWLPSNLPPSGPWIGLADSLSQSTPEIVCSIAAEYGAQSVLCVEMLHSGLDIEAKAEGFARACSVAAKYGLQVLLEMLPTSGISSLADASKIVEYAGATNGALMLDSWHCFRTNTAIADIAALPAGTIGALQICDGPAAAESDLAHAMMHDRLLPGDGDFPLAEWVAATRATGCTAPLSVEVISDAVGAMPMDSIAQACMAAVRSVAES